MPSDATVPQPKVSAKGKAALDALLKSSVDGGVVCPATTFGATTAEGPIYFEQYGPRVFGEPDKGSINENTMLELYSATKLVTTISVLQLVDRGLVDLDDSALIEKLCPDLCALKILTGFDDAGVPQFTERKQPITLRRLLSHTSGLAYDFFSPLLKQWVEKTGFKGYQHYPGTEGYQTPLVFEPGSAWLYSIGIDWAGIVVERVSKQTLQEYFHANIFGPLGLGVKDITFIPTEDVRARLQSVCKRNPDGSLALGQSFHDLNRTAETIGQLSGGGGLLGTAKAYLRFLQGVLASAQPGPEALISPASFKELFTDSLSPKGTPAGDAMHKNLGWMTTMQSYHDPNHTTNDAQHLGHSVGLVLSLADSANGRKKGSGCWDGAAKTEYWLDPTTGVAGIIFTQLLSENPDPYMKLYTQYERALYDALE